MFCSRGLQTAGLQRGAILWKIILRSLKESP